MARVTSTVGKASRPDVWLQSVACASARACTAVGVFDAHRLALSLGNGVPVAERWNGRQWSLQRMPDVPNGKPDQLSISCPSQSECFVVGSVITSSIDSYPRVEVPLVERWSNGAWSIQRSANAARRFVARGAARRRVVWRCVRVHGGRLRGHGGIALGGALGRQKMVSSAPGGARPRDAERGVVHVETSLHRRGGRRESRPTRRTGTGLAGCASSPTRAT